MPPRYQSKGTSRAWVQAALVLLCAVFMLPRLASAQFGLFDDGVTLTNTRQILTGEWTMAFDRGAGRFRPVYWVFNTLLASVGGESPVVFYLGNFLVLTGTVFAIFYITRKATKSILAASLAGALFLFSGPVVESFYTLSKSEPLQVLLLLAAVAVFLSPWPRPARFLAGTALLALANLVKETGLVMVAVTGGWLLIAWIARRVKKDTLSLAPSADAFLASVLAAGLFLVLRVFFLSGGLAGGTYANSYLLDAGALAESALRWAGWIVRDFPHLLILAAAWIILLITRRKFADLALGAAALIWMAGWVIVFLPWVYMVEYYMLPFSAGASFFMALVLTRLLDELRSRERRKRVWAATATGLTALLILPTLVNNYSAMRIQLLVDQANHNLLKTLADLPPDSTLIMSNQDESEYSKEILIHLDQIYHRNDISLQLYRGGPLPAGTFGLMPVIENQPGMTIRIGLDEPTQTAWNAIFQDTLDRQPVSGHYDEISSIRLASVEIPRAAGWLVQTLKHNPDPDLPFALLDFNYGWKISQAGEW